MNLRITARERWRVVFWGCLAIVLLLALTPTGPSMPTVGWDKLDHLFAFAFLSIAGRQSYPGLNTSIFLGLLFYGGLIEGLQSFTPYRSAEWADLIADGLGVIIGWGLHGLLRKSDRTDCSG